MGILKTSSAYTGILAKNNDAILIGKNYNVPQYFNGKIDDIRIYNYSRSADQVMQDYNAGMSAHAGVATGEAYPWAGALPVAHWRLDENTGKKAYDASQNKNDGTLTNMEEADWVLGKYGSALQFDGVNEYVNAGNDTSLNTPNEVTLEAWVKPAGTADGGVVSRWHGQFLWTMSINTGGAGKIRLSYTNGVSQENLDSTGTISTNVWSHIAITKTASSYSFYINGVQDRTGTPLYGRSEER